MNEKNSLEAQLRSWTPRRPSPGLERRLFPRRSSARRSEMLAWLVPATVCGLLVTMTLLQPGDPTFGVSARDHALTDMAYSNQSYAAFLPGSFQSAANRLDTFEWTNAGGSLSSMDSLLPPKGKN